MTVKKEVQEKILEEQDEGKATKEEFLSILRLCSPGTNLRTGLDGIVKAGKGALIVVENEFLTPIIDGGFKINSRFTPQRLIELSKMDGAIILSKDMKRITNANVTLAPDTKIPTKETGTRHKAGERSAKMINGLAMAVSERKNEIHIYYKNIRYHLRSTEEVSRKATETLHLLEKQRELFDNELATLDEVEKVNDLSLSQACKVIQRGKSMEKILQSQEKTLIELGKEGEALKLRIKELIRGVEKETDLIIKDYTKLNVKKSKNIFEALTYEELIDEENILTALARKESRKVENIKGWRMLQQTSLNEKDLAAIIGEMKNLGTILYSSHDSFEEILGEEKAGKFNKDLERIRNK